MRHGARRSQGTRSRLRIRTNWEINPQACQDCLTSQQMDPATTLETLLRIVPMEGGPEARLRSQTACRGRYCSAECDHGCARGARCKEHTVPHHVSDELHGHEAYPTMGRGQGLLRPWPI